MDERILTILKAVAYGELCSDDGDNYCPYDGCEAWNPSGKYDNPLHDATCIVTLARQVLSEMGMPLLLYRIDSEYRGVRPQEWQVASPSYQLAFNEQEIRDRWPEDADLTHLGHHLLRRNVQVSVIGEAQEALQKEAQG